MLRTSVLYIDMFEALTHFSFMFRCFDSSRSWYILVMLDVIGKWKCIGTIFKETLCVSKVFLLRVTYHLRKFSRKLIINWVDTEVVTINFMGMQTFKVTRNNFTYLYRNLRSLCIGRQRVIESMKDIPVSITIPRDAA